MTALNSSRRAGWPPASEDFPDADGEPRPHELEVLGRPMSVLGVFVDRPRAVVVALHGGGSSKEYFDTPVDPALSLLRLGAALGFTVVAIDRPGYGPDAAGDPVDARARTDLLFGTLDALFADRPVGAGLLLLAHSMGCVSALRMAADDERGGHLLGVELSGTGRTYHPRAAAIAGGGTQRVGGPSLGRLIWGPDDLYPPGTREAQRSVTGSASEGDDARGWPTELPALAARVRVPVRYALAEHESWWLPGAEGLDDVAALFTAAPVVETAIEPNAGHNISLGRTARAYHLRVFAFAEQCLARRGR